MKKLILPIAAVLVLASCQKESTDAIENQGVSEIDVAAIKLMAEQTHLTTLSDEELNKYDEMMANFNEKELRRYFDFLTEYEVSMLDDKFTEYEKSLIATNFVRLQLNVDNFTESY